MADIAATTIITKFLDTTLLRLILPNISWMFNTVPKLDFNLPFPYKYVGDITTAVPNNKLDGILKTFNSHNSFLEFTVQMENPNCVSFLDILTMTKNKKPT